MNTKNAYTSLACMHPLELDAKLCVHEYFLIFASLIAISIIIIKPILA
jgi:hypothetical protein